MFSPTFLSGSAKQTAAGPYRGTPATVPGVIEAEQFDFGGEGVAYSDTTIDNIQKVGGKGVAGDEVRMSYLTLCRVWRVSALTVGVVCSVYAVVGLG